MDLSKYNKFSNNRSTNDGYSFASKGEAECYATLKLLQRAKEIEILQVQCQVLLSHAEIIYKPDFKIKDLKSGKIVYVEFKGFETPEWRIKRRLWISYGPGELRIYKKANGRIYLDETLVPKTE